MGGGGKVLRDSQKYHKRRQQPEGDPQKETSGQPHHPGLLTLRTADSGHPTSHSGPSHPQAQPTRHYSIPSFIRAKPGDIYTGPPRLPAPFLSSSHKCHPLETTQHWLKKGYMSDLGVQVCGPAGQAHAASQSLTTPSSLHVSGEREKVSWSLPPYTGQV